MIVHRAIGAQQRAPAGYSVDFGVTDRGDTLLGEVKGGYSLGHGALTSSLDAELLRARGLEITGS